MQPNYINMKITRYALLLLAAVSITCGASAQLRKIPAEVTNAFSEKYPNAKNVEWRDELKDFKVTFSLDSAAGSYTAKYAHKGDWKVTEKEITEAALPDEIRQSLSKSLYADWKTRSVYILYFPADMTEYHIIVAKSDINKKNLLFSKDGKLLKDNFTL